VFLDQAEIGSRGWLQGVAGVVVVELEGWIWKNQGVKFTIVVGFQRERAFENRRAKIGIGA